MRILVTGGAGFVGSHLCEALIKRGHRVVALDNFYSSSWENIRGLFRNPNFYFVMGDVNNYSIVEKLVGISDCVIHLAAQIHPDNSVVQPFETVQTNVMGTMNVLEACRLHCVPVIYASSSEVYGNTDVVPTPETAPMKPATPYAASKASADRLAYSYYYTYGLKTVIVRCFNMFGERQREVGYGLVIPRFVRRVWENRSPLVYGTGEQTRDFMHVSNGVEAYLAVLDHLEEVAGEAFNFGSGEEIKIKDLAYKIIKVMGKEGKIEPKFVEPRAGEVMRMCADTTKARRVLGWRIKVSFDEGLKRYIEWFAGKGGDVC
jgi:dTDP-glucose 4,6-dehydratase